MGVHSAQPCRVSRKKIFARFCLIRGVNYHLGTSADLKVGVGVAGWLANWQGGQGAPPV